MVKSTGLVTGVLSLRGRVDVLSLVNFYKVSMPRDGWQFITSFESPEKTIMVFEKGERWAVINITGNAFYTYLEIAVAPGANMSSGNQPSMNSPVPGGGSGLLRTQ